MASKKDRKKIRRRYERVEAQKAEERRKQEELVVRKRIPQLLQQLEGVDVRFLEIRMLSETPFKLGKCYRASLYVYEESHEVIICPVIAIGESDCTTRSMRQLEFFVESMKEEGFIQAVSCRSSSVSTVNPVLMVLVKKRGIEFEPARGHRWYHDNPAIADLVEYPEAHDLVAKAPYVIDPVVSWSIVIGARRSLAEVKYFEIMTA